MKCGGALRFWLEAVFRAMRDVAFAHEQAGEPLREDSLFCVKVVLGQNG